MKHLDSKEMLTILNGGESPHLSECDLCVERLSALKEFQMSGAQACYIGDTRTDDCLSHEEIADIVEGSMEKAEHLDKCDYCFANAAYYFSETAAMKAGEIVKTGPEFLEKALSLFPENSGAKPAGSRERSSRWFDRIVIAPLPAYATAVVFWLVLSVLSSPMSVRILSGGSEYTIYNNPDANLPYFHFGKTGVKIGALPGSMRIEPGRKRITFSWPKVEDAELYRFVLQDVTDGIPRTIMQRSTKETSVAIPRRRLSPSRRYRWITAGPLPEGNYFVGEVEFRFGR